MGTAEPNLTFFVPEAPPFCNNTMEEDDLRFMFGSTHGLVIPIIAAIGMILNVLNLVVLNSGKLLESSYTYLTGLAIADFGSLLVFFINGIGRGYFPKESGWRVFEAYVYFPCGFVTSTAGALLTVTVSAERFIFIYKPMKARQWCTVRVARVVMMILWVVCLALNIPRFFVFTVNTELGKLDYTDFGKSQPYKYLSWFQFLFVSCSCGVALIILNILLIIGIHRRNNQRQMLGAPSSPHQKIDELRLTRTLISIVFIFLMGEIPSSLTSRGLVVGLSGDPCIVEGRGFKIISLVATVLVVLQLSLNFVVYCVFNLKFWATFKQQMCRDRSRFSRNLYLDNNNPKCELNSFHGEQSKLNEKSDTEEL